MLSRDTASRLFSKLEKKNERLRSNKSKTQNMETKEKILQTLLKIQELVESIADNQHRPKGYEYDFTLDQSDNGNDLKPVNKKPFPKYWWTYTEGLPDVIKDWFVANHKVANKWFNDYDFIGHRKNFGNYFMIDFTDYLECEYVTHQQIIDHYGLSEKSGVNLMDYTKKEEVKIDVDEQPKKLYTKEEILMNHEIWWEDDSYKGGFNSWIEQKM